MHSVICTSIYDNQKYINTLLPYEYPGKFRFFSKSRLPSRFYHLTFPNSSTLANSCINLTNTVMSVLHFVLPSHSFCGQEPCDVQRGSKEKHNSSLSGTIPYTSFFKSQGLFHRQGGNEITQ